MQFKKYKYKFIFLDNYNLKKKIKIMKYIFKKIKCLPYIFIWGGQDFIRLGKQLTLIIFFKIKLTLLTSKITYIDIKLIL